MNRLTSGTVSLIALLVVSGCNNDPTEDLRGPVTRIQATPSTVNVTQGKTKTIQFTAQDDQGNPIPSVYQVTAVGSGISVKRDSTFFEQFVGDSLTVPALAPTFQFIVSGTDLTTSSFTVSAGGQEVVVPVTVTADPANVPGSPTVVSTGPNASDETVIAPQAGFLFSPDAAVAFDAGPAIVLSVAEDGSSITILPPPGATSKGFVTGMFLTYFPQSLVDDSTDVALTINPTVPSQPGTGDPATAPDITDTPLFYDGGSFAGPDLAGDCAPPGCGTQYYKFTPAEDGDYTFTINWGNTSDVDVVLCEDAACLASNFDGATGDQPEEPVYTLTAGTTYYIALTLFAGPLPPWVSFNIH